MTPHTTPQRHTPPTRGELAVSLIAAGAILAGVNLLAEHHPQPTPEARARVLTLAMPEGCEPPTAPGDQLYMRVHVTASGTPQTDCAAKRLRP